MSEIETLTDEVMQIYDENMYDENGLGVGPEHSSTEIEGFGGSSSSRGRHTSKSGEEKVVVGFEKEVETLLKLLDNKQVGLQIISIIGAAGGGKTTLAKQVYEHPFMSHTFEIRAWVNVSQAYNKTTKKEFLIGILKSASPKKHEDYENSNEDQLGEVHKCLKGRKYLNVMDDIWGIEAWNDIQRSFPRERKGNKVLFTSRFVVQPDGISCVPHCLAPLMHYWSWKLLAKKVFGMKGCPQELEGVGWQIAEKCVGLPLAVVAIAGILVAEEKTLNMWKKVAKHLSLIIANKNQERCMDILELSYNHLPLHLKKCFVCIGGFPEDYEIPVHKLIWLWVTKGFIQQCEGGKSLEAIANDYLIGLVDRNLVTVAGRRYLGEIRAIRVHDLWRILCLKKVEEDEFFVQIYEEGDSFSPFYIYKHRRLGFLRKFFNHLQYDTLNERLSPISRAIVYSDFLHACCSALYSVINNRTAGYEPGIKVPHNIFEMVELRHLYTKSGIFKYHLSHISSKKAVRNPSKLNSLQTLHPTCPCKDCRTFLVRTPNLKKLGFYGKLLSRDGILMLPDLEFLKCLETLSFTNSRYFGHEGSSLPAGLKLPLTITRLTLKYTYLKWEELSILQTLPSLEVLKLLAYACSGQVWNANELEGFFQLST